ncbi:MAG TPA: tetratricopeptide repeat protein [Anaeromyxobacteraceae bacterium]|nr:tetratricopeptide repeat protein [Anaeromyxobacteraceae bacterium]
MTAPCRASSGRARRPRRAPLLLAALLAGPAAGAPALDGDYDSPLGRVRIAAGEQGVTGTLEAPSALCPFRPGTEILRGTLLDDSLAGQMRVCLGGRSCREKEAWSSAVLLVGPGQLSGAVHVAQKGCLGPFGKKGGVTLARSGGSQGPSPPGRGRSDSPETTGGEGARPSATPVETTTGEGARPSATPAARRARARKLLRDGAGHLAEGNFEQARRRFLEAIEADPKVPEAYNGVGVTWRMRNDLRQALEWYKKALAVDPDFGDAYYNMACVYAVEGKAELALRYLKIASLNGYATAEGIAQDPDLASLRESPEYQSLVRARM